MAAPKVKFKRSSVAGKVPALANLDTGELALNTYDGKLFLKVDTGGIGIGTTVSAVNPWTENYGASGLSYTGNINVSGVSTFQNKVHLLDGDKLHLGGAAGDSGDLQIYHDDTHSYIDDAGTGNLRLRSGVIEITNLAGSKTSAQFSSGSGQELYFNNSKKFETTTSGVTITGTVSATAFSGDGSALTNISAGSTANVSTNTLVVVGVSTVNKLIIEGTSASTTTTDYSEVVLSGLSPSSFNQTYTRQSTGFVLDTGTAGSGNALFHADSNYYYYVASTGSFANGRALIWSVEDNKWVTIFDMSGNLTEGNVSNNDAVGSVFTTDVTANSTTADSRSVPTASGSIVYSTTGSPGGPVGVTTLTTDGSATFTGIVTATTFKASDQFYPPTLTTAARDAISFNEGAMIYNSSVKRIQFYDGSNWISLGGLAAAIAFH